MKVLHAYIGKYFTEKEAFQAIVDIRPEEGEARFLATSKEVAEKLTLANENVGTVFWIEKKDDWFLTYKSIIDKGTILLENGLSYTHEDWIALSNFNKMK
tara:strand:+ start:164 stop:463 length:300 start_codon:yes stop_codon:yes gene_type:complete